LRVTNHSRIAASRSDASAGDTHTGIGRIGSLWAMNPGPPPPRPPLPLNQAKASEDWRTPRRSARRPRRRHPKVLERASPLVLWRFSGGRETR
jgi:hypothetical protein